MLKNSSSFKKRCGFTLVELSIVIIIIALLISGIVSGMSLIKSAKLNSVISDLQDFRVAYNTFQSTYSALPGDMQNATAYFSACAQSNANCNGNGDGLIQFNAGLPDETYSAWRQLSLAKLITAPIELIPDGWSGFEIIDQTIPASKINNAGYLIVGGTAPFASDGTNTIASPFPNKNVIVLGQASSSYGLGNAALTPDEAFNIDGKIDDGEFIVGNVDGVLPNTNSIFINNAYASSPGLPSHAVGSNTGKLRSIQGLDAISSGANCYDAQNRYDLSVDKQACIIAKPLT